MPNFIMEKTFEGPVAGVDEAGCGPWSGPVVAGAVIFDDYDAAAKELSMLDDSKKLTKLKREKLFEQLHEMPGVHIGVGQCTREEIDSLNIRQAALLAMKRAVEDMSIAPAHVLADGTGIPDLACDVQPIVKGDALSLSIAAASVIAKVTRDKIMTRLAAKYPEYGWERNSGYGTAEHQKAINEYGITPHHRRSFAPIAKHIEGKLNEAF